MILFGVCFISTVLAYLDAFSVRKTGMGETETVHREASTPGTHRNKLNDPSGRDWTKFTKSWFFHRPQPRADRKIRHPPSSPEPLVTEFASFVTRKCQLVADP